MKLLVILLTMLSTISVAQTKQETEKWIREKLTTYFDRGPFFSENSYSMHKNLIITFRDCELTFTYDVFEAYYSADDVRNNTPKKLLYSYSVKNVVPIGQIEKVEFDLNTLYIHVKKKAIKMYARGKNSKVYNKAVNMSIASIGIDRNGEANLENRILKAFNHLRSFCKLAITPEPF